ncbi:flagellar basal body rod protein FlgC [Rhizobium sp. L1K21]|uniref:flagellar basal body rod protein FlgC n=1 Tax=Rhizobium sp. L1K21 TaxID=2954933 RepID=UPI0020932DA1|nr:flagellar basal body rod C-terminal domain-containing protein [Rhizobium sp. L1K21]MCO6185860.1 flagellar basal body protein [Rhizobium sp. L1K21]
MSLSAVMSTAMSGMLAQERRATASANNIANAQTPNYDRLETTLNATGGGAGVEARVAPSGNPDPNGGSNVNMTDEMLNVMEAELSYKANAAVFETGADMWDLLATIQRD